MKKYQIVEIFRTSSAKKDYEFVCLLYNGNLVSKKTKPSLSEKLRKGEIFKGDFVNIKDDTGESVDMEVCEEEGDTYDGILNYCEYIYGPEKYLPFLNDTLPYYKQPIESHPVQKLCPTTFSANTIMFYHSLNTLTVPLIGKIAYKTRINYNNCKYYFFLILKINNELLKVFIWRENIKYSSLKVGDTVGLIKYRVNKGYQGLSCLDYNRFSESAYFDTKEVTGIELMKFATTFKTADKKFLPTVEGFVSYKSVLTRRNHGGLDEYYLLIVDNKPVVLFYNSDPIFYEIEAGNHMSITNLRQERRAGFEFYISTIFTQIELEKDSEPDELVSSFLYEGRKPLKRHIDDEVVTKKRLNNDQLQDNNSLLENDIKSDQPNNERIRDNSLCSESDSSDDKKDDTLLIADLVENNLKKNQPFQNYVEVAFGYLPDNFSNMDEICRETFTVMNEKEYAVPMFLKPLKTTISELLKGINMVINEVTKWVVRAELSGVDFSNYNDWEEQTINNGTCISYIENNVIKEQMPAYIKIKENDEMICYLFPNHFTKETNLSDLYRTLNAESYEDVLNMIGKTYNFVVQAFRASSEGCLFIITGVIKSE